MTDFRLSDSFVEKYVRKRPEWGPIGYITYKSKYARPVDGENRTEEWWETIRRVVEGCYSIQKDHCERLRLPWNHNKAQKSAQEMYDLMWQMKFLPPGRGLWMMGTDFVNSKGSAALNNCFSGDTKFFGHDALMTLKDAADSEQEVYVRSYDGMSRPARVRSFGKQPTQAVVFKPHGLRSNFKLEYVVTPNHEWILSDGSRTTSLKVGDKVTVRPYESKPDLSEQVFYMWSNEYIHGFAHGLVFGGGTRHTYYPYRHFIRLCGEKNKKYAKTLARVTGCVSTTSPPSYSGDQVVTLISQRNLKRLPEDTDPLEYRQGFLDGWIAADASQKPSGSVCLHSQNAEAIDWVIERAPLLGYCVTGDNYDSVMETNIGVRSAPMRRLSMTRNPTTYVVKEIHELEEKEVFCVTEPQTSSFTLGGGIFTGNCAFVSTKEINVDFAEPFCFLMDMSMLGVGVGGDTKGAGGVKIKQPRDGDYTFTVEDSREGWVELVRTVLNAYVWRGSLPKETDYSKVRPYGEPIKTFGGTASGPAPLQQLVQDIKDILDPLVDESITSEAIADIFNAIGKCVVSGNVRRSAEIMLGDATDDLFLSLKDKEKDERTAFLCSDEGWRWASNNSVFATIGMDYSKPTQYTKKNGEIGYFWLETARRFGRLCDPANDADALAEGCNPCGEQTLESYELCCLVETFPGRHENLEDFVRTLKFAYLYAKTVTLVPTHNARTNAVMLRNRRIGTSQSGIVQSLRRHGIRQHLKWCDHGYQYLRDLDRIYSRWLCVPTSVKVTSVKPSGTISLLPGATPGIHFPLAEYYWRCQRFSTGSPFVKAFRDAGYRIEKGEGHDTVVIYFPVKEENFWKSKGDVTIWEQLELAAQMQKYWSDNQVSVTVTFKPEEADQIELALQFYEDKLKAVSFLPLLTIEEMKEKGYEHPPYQELTKEEYEQAVAELKAVKLRKVTETQGFERTYCDSDRCELVIDEPQG